MGRRSLGKLSKVEDRIAIARGVHCAAMGRHLELLINELDEEIEEEESGAGHGNILGSGLEGLK